MAVGAACARAARMVIMKERVEDFIFGDIAGWVKGAVMWA